MMDVLHMQSVNEHSSLDRASSTASAGGAVPNKDVLKLAASFPDKFFVCVKFLQSSTTVVFTFNKTD